LSARNPDGGWGGAVGGPSSIEETALALEALAGKPSPDRIAVTEVVRNAVEWLIARVESGEWKNPAPIGLYFARLWYYEKLYPQIFTLGALASLERRGT
jgi:squalene-hopene/tetraprenyl-beta-curcumene cyclase